jgi:hypothetical protein
MVTKLVTREFHRDLLEELEIPDNCIDETIIDTSRWAVHYEGVFEYEKKHYQVQWQQGATEYQEGEDLWYNADVIEAVEVVKLPVVKYEWTPKRV